MDPDASAPSDEPSVFNYVLSFLLVGVAWGFTTPFIRRAAADFNARQESLASTQQTQDNSTKSKDLDTQDGMPESRENDSDSSDPSKENEDEDGEEEDPPLASSSAAPSTSTATSQKPAWMTPKASSSSWLRKKIVTLFWTVVNLLRTPAYSIPLVINLTGSIWFFLLVGKHELSLTVPLANSSAFLFTVLGEWYVERKVIAKETWLGLALVLGGIGLCVQSKNQA